MMMAATTTEPCSQSSRAPATMVASWLTQRVRVSSMG